jgi:uncharacterized protein YjbI with pentapeptide repeats
MAETRLQENHLLRFDVEIPEFPSDKTAVIHFYDENRKRISTYKFAIISADEIYEWIRGVEEINLDNCYVKDFSLEKYRSINGLGKHAVVKLHNFSARNTFFDCDATVDFSYAEFEGEKTDFGSAVFANGFVNFFNCDFGHGDVSFQNTRFGNGSISFRSVKFGDGDISFNGTNFGSGDVSFVDANFSNGNVDYKNSVFGNGTIDFKFAKFASGDITFERAVFGKGRKDFKNVEFGGGRIDFRRVEFNDGDVSFDGVEFGDGKVSFRSSVFGHGHKSFEFADFAHGEAQFDSVDFGSGTISFRQARTTNISFTGCHLNSYIDLRFGECHHVDLRNTIVRDILDAKPENEKVVIREMNLSGMRILGRIFINWRENNVYDLIYNQKNSTLFQKAEQFRILKENFRNNGQYDDEDFAYLEFRRCEAKADLQWSLQKDKMIKLSAYPTYYFKKYVFDYVGRYATSPMRVLLNGVIAVFLFALLYFIFTEFLPFWGHVATALPAELDRTHDFLNNIYYSAITFCTVGYGDYFAAGFVKVLAAFEGFTGIFLMSYFTVAFVRKILR